MKLRHYVMMLFITLMFMGCAHVGTDKGGVVVATSEALKYFTGEYENTEYFKKHKPASIAVLPFHYAKRKSYSIDFDSEDPGGVIRRGMYNHIASLPFRDLEIYKTDKLLKNAGIADTPILATMIAENPKKLKSILGVDAAVAGEVTHFDRIYLGIYSQVAVGCEVKMWDLQTGKLLWRAKQVSRAHAGGLSLNPIGIAMSTVASLWNLRATELLSQTDDLFREIVSTIDLPESFKFIKEPLPRIDLFAVINAGRPFTVGKKAAFRIIGDPQCSAYVDLADFKSNIQLTPVPADVKKTLRAEVLEAIKKNYKETGHILTPELVAAIEQELISREIYEGFYTVASGEQAYGLLAKAYLVNSAGGQGTAIDAAQYVDVDALPPQTTSGLTAEPLDNKIKIRWDQNSEEDLSHYEIWSSSTPLSGYSLLSKSEKNVAIIKNLHNFTRVYLRIRAIDKASNAGDFGKYIETVPLPEQGLYDLSQPGPVLSGEIKEKTLLVADKSPYTVLSDLRITQEGALYIEPGVEILFSPDSSLTITGGDFFAYGTSEKPIHFAAKVGREALGAWNGIVMDGVKRSTLQHITIKGATTGFTISNSAPSITALTITRCSQAGLYLKEMARPNISCSVFTFNEGQGALVMEGEGLAPVIRNNVFENNEPFQVQSYTPLQIDLKENYWGRSKPEANWFLGDIVWRPALVEPSAFCSRR